MKTLRQRALQIALDHFLSKSMKAKKWERSTLEDLTMMNNIGKITIWQPYENMGMNDLIEHIEDLATAIEYEFKKDIK